MCNVYDIIMFFSFLFKKLGQQMQQNSANRIICIRWMRHTEYKETSYRSNARKKWDVGGQKDGEREGNKEERERE